MTGLAALPAGPVSRVVYLGTPAMAVPPLEAIVAAGITVERVITRVDKRRGRGSELTPSPVKAAAVRLGLPVGHAVDEVLDTGAELGVVVAFGQLIREPVLQRLPMVNLHFSLLPRWRGAAPVERALLAGDAVTGVCLMQLEVGLDTGGIIDQIEVPIRPRHTLDDLRRDLVDAGTTLLVQNLRSGLPVPRLQQGDATYAQKLTADDFRIDWTQGSEAVARVVRLGSAWTTFRGKRLKVLEAEPLIGDDVPHGVAGTLIAGSAVATWDGAVELVTVQPEGKPAMPASAWANGARPQIGETVGEPLGAAPAGS